MHIPITHAEWVALTAGGLPPTSAGALERAVRDGSGVHLATARAALSVLHAEGDSGPPVGLERPLRLTVSPGRPLHLGATPFPKGRALGTESPAVAAVSLMVLALQWREHPVALGPCPGLGWVTVDVPWPLWQRAPLAPGEHRAGSELIQHLLANPDCAWVETDDEIALHLWLDAPRSIGPLALLPGHHHFTHSKR